MPVLRDKIDEKAPSYPNCAVTVKPLGSLWGGVNYDRKDSEKSNMIFRCSLYAVENIKKGSAFTKSNVRSIRPGYGVHPKFLHALVGKKSSRSIERVTPIDLSIMGDDFEL